MGGMFSAPKAPPPPPTPTVADPAIQEKARSERLAKQRAAGRASTILTDSKTEDFTAGQKKSLLGE